MDEQVLLWKQDIPVDQHTFRSLVVTASDRLMLCLVHLCWWLLPPAMLQVASKPGLRLAAVTRFRGSASHPAQPLCWLRLPPGGVKTRTAPGSSDKVQRQCNTSSSFMVLQVRTRVKLSYMGNPSSFWLIIEAGCLQGQRGVNSLANM